MDDLESKAQKFAESYKALVSDIDKHEATATTESALAHELRKMKETCDNAKEFFRSKHGLEVKDPKNLHVNGAKFLRAQAALRSEVKFNWEMLAKFPQPEFGYKEKAENANAVLELYVAAEAHVLKEAKDAEKMAETAEKIEPLNISTEKQESIAGVTAELKPIFKTAIEAPDRGNGKSLR